MKTTYERFWEKVAVTPSCWLWTASGTHNGYGLFWLEGKSSSAHRVSYEMEVGPIPEGLQLDHLCRVRECVNPSHLEPVTQAENRRRGEKGETGKHNADKTHCPQGHEYNLENTRNYLNGRYCRACDRERCRKRYRKNKKLGLDSRSF